MVDFKSMEMYLHIIVRLIFSLCKTGWRVGGRIITECLIVNGKLCGWLVLLLGKSY